MNDLNIEWSKFIMGLSSCKDLANQVFIVSDFNFISTILPNFIKFLKSFSLYSKSEKLIIANW